MFDMTSMIVRLTLVASCFLRKLLLGLFGCSTSEFLAVEDAHLTLSTSGHCSQHQARSPTHTHTHARTQYQSQLLQQPTRDEDLLGVVSMGDELRALSKATVDLREV